MIPFPKKKYKIIYADPPWEYNDKNCSGAVAQQYSEMKIEEICGLPVSSITADNCILFIWGTWPKLPECLKVIKAWGFEYKSIGFVWVKTYSNGKYQLGLGRWTRGNTEFCLLAKKGKIKRMSSNISQLIVSELKGHSKKPNLVRTKILELVGDLPRIELFARQKIPDWDVWGNDKNLKVTTLEGFASNDC